MENSIKFCETWIPQRADPFVTRAEDGTYYFTASVPAYDRIALRASKSLYALSGAKEVTIWEKHESGPMSQHIWAPELHRINGKWYIYFGASNAEDIWRLRPYILECEGDDPIHDKWTERGTPVPAPDDEFSFRAFSLDGTVFENGGKHYFIWAEKVSVGRQISNLYIAEMSDPCTMKTAQVLLTSPDYDWERVGFWVNEGPAVIKRNGKIFLTYSASETGAAYCMGMLTADGNADLLDPLSWKKSRYPVLNSDASRGIFGPGHNSFTVDENGNDIMVFHARTESEITGDPLYNPNRHAMLMPVKWDENGCPVFSFDNRL